MQSTVLELDYIKGQAQKDKTMYELETKLYWRIQMLPQIDSLLPVAKL